MKKSKLMQYASNLFTVVLIIALVITAASFIRSRLYPGQPVSVFGLQPLSVLSGSMYPALLPGDMILVRARDAATIETGDILTYRVGGDTLVTHRVTEVVAEDGEIRFRTKGDANNVEDASLIAPEQIVGTMALRVPYGGYAAKFVRSPYGLVLFILVPILMLLSSEIKNLLAETGDEKKKTSPEDGAQV